MISAAEAEENEQIFTSEIGQNVVGPLWNDAQASLLAELDSVTLEDLCQRALKKGPAEAPAEGSHFEI